MNNRKFNFNIGEFTWFVLLFAISVYFYELVRSGNVTMFINPNISKYVIFASGALLILAIFQIPRIINTPDSKPKFGYLIFMIPIIIGILVNPVGLNMQITEAKGVNIQQTQNSAQTNTKIVKESVPMPENNKIVMTDKSYFAFLNEISDDPNRFKDCNITLIGFVYKDSSIKKGQLVISRMLITCCAADAQVVGFLCDYNGPNLDQNTWVEITGVLDSENYTDTDTKQTSLVPLIRAKSIKKVDTPKSKYIYLTSTY